MKISIKLLIITCAVPILIWISGIHVAGIAEQSLTKSIETSALKEIKAVQEEIISIALEIEKHTATDTTICQTAATKFEPAMDRLEKVIARLSWD